MALRTWPRWRYPVGAGAKRVTTNTADFFTSESEDQASKLAGGDTTSRPMSCLSAPSRASPEWPVPHPRPDCEWSSRKSPPTAAPREELLQQCLRMNTRRHADIRFTPEIGTLSTRTDRKREYKYWCRSARERALSHTRRKT